MAIMLADEKRLSFGSLHCARLIQPMTGICAGEIIVGIDVLKAVAGLEIANAKALSASVL